MIEDLTEEEIVALLFAVLVMVIGVISFVLQYPYWLKEGAQAIASCNPGCQLI